MRADKSGGHVAVASTDVAYTFWTCLRRQLDAAQHCDREHGDRE
jgi:hypothetical protein